MADNNNIINPNAKTERDLTEIFSENLKHLMDEKGITQKELADELGVAGATMTDYCNGRRLPKLEVLHALTTKYEITIDDILREGFSVSGISGYGRRTTISGDLLDTYRKHAGIYYVYYFDTSKYKGRDSEPPKDSVLFGILFIYETRYGTEVSEFGCAAVLGIKDREEVTLLKKTLEGFNDPANIINHIDNNYSSSAYYGDFELSQEHVFITLNHTNTDKALLILHRVENNKPIYTGGIGTVNSVSKGRERAPVVQFMGVSRYPLSMSIEEIHHSLLLNYPTFKAGEETEEMIQNLRTLFVAPEGSKQGFSEYDQTIVVRSSLERYIKKSLERNMFRYGKISERDDDEWYHAIKNASISE